MIIYAKLSDVFGRKPMIIAAVVIFVISPGACGAAQNVLQLWIALRQMSCVCLFL